MSQCRRRFPKIRMPGVIFIIRVSISIPVRPVAFQLIGKRLLRTGSGDRLNSGVLRLFHPIGFAQEYDGLFERHTHFEVFGIQLPFLLNCTEELAHIFAQRIADLHDGIARK